MKVRWQGEQPFFLKTAVIAQTHLPETKKNDSKWSTNFYEIGKDITSAKTVIITELTWTRDGTIYLLM